MKLTEKEIAMVKFALQYVCDSKFKIVSNNRQLMTDAEIDLIRENALEFGKLMDKIK